MRNPTRAGRVIPEPRLSDMLAAVEREWDRETMDARDFDGPVPYDADIEVIVLPYSESNPMAVVRITLTAPDRAPASIVLSRENALAFADDVRTLAEPRP